MNGGAGGTRLLVAHRAATAARADAVAWLDGGRVRAVGPHAELWRLAEYRAVFGAGRRRTAGRGPSCATAAGAAPEGGGPTEAGHHDRRDVRARSAVPAGPVAGPRPARRLVRAGDRADLPHRVRARPRPGRGVSGRAARHRARVARRWPGSGCSWARAGPDGCTPRVAALVEPLRDRPGRAGGRARGAGGGRGGAVRADPAGGDRPGHVRRAGDGVAFVRVHRRRGRRRTGSRSPRCSCWSWCRRSPPGLALFAATLRPLARRQEAFLVADEALADGLGRRLPGAAGHHGGRCGGPGRRRHGPTASTPSSGPRAPSPAGASCAWSSLAVGGQLPIVLLLAAAPWLLARGVTAGALVGALAYVTQSLLPALRNLVHGLGTSGSRLAVVATSRRHPPPAPAATPPADAGRRPGGSSTAQPGPHDRSRSAPPPRPPHTPAPPPPTPRPVPRLRHLRLRPRRRPRRRRPRPRPSRPAPIWPSSAPAGSGSPRSPALVAGLLQPTGGRIRLCGHPVPGPDAAALRVLIPQEAYVFTGTLAREPRLSAAGPGARAGAARRGRGGRARPAARRARRIRTTGRPGRAVRR